MGSICAGFFACAGRKRGWRQPELRFAARLKPFECASPDGRALRRIFFTGTFRADSTCFRAGYFLRHGPMAGSIII